MKTKQVLNRFDKKYTIEEIFPHILDHQVNKKEYERKEFDGHLINFNSLRLITFKQKGIICSGCGIKGSFFVKEKHFKIEEPYHLNFYALDNNGNEILMTHDHIIPKFKGGKNIIENTQTMCTICNRLKDDPELTKCIICGGEKKATEPWCSGCEADSHLERP